MRCFYWKRSESTHTKQSAADCKLTSRLVATHLSDHTRHTSMYQPVDFAPPVVAPLEGMQDLVQAANGRTSARGWMLLCLMPRHDMLTWSHWHCMPNMSTQPQRPARALQFWNLEPKRGPVTAGGRSVQQASSRRGSFCIGQPCARLSCRDAVCRQDRKQGS